MVDSMHAENTIIPENNFNEYQQKLVNVRQRNAANTNRIYKLVP